MDMADRFTVIGDFGRKVLKSPQPHDGVVSNFAQLTSLDELADSDNPDAEDNKVVQLRHRDRPSLDGYTISGGGELGNSSGSEDLGSDVMDIVEQFEKDLLYKTLRDQSPRRAEEFIQFDQKLSKQESDYRTGYTIGAVVGIHLEALRDCRDKLLNSFSIAQAA